MGAVIAALISVAFQANQAQEAKSEQRDRNREAKLKAQRDRSARRRAQIEQIKERGQTGPTEFAFAGQDEKRTGLQELRIGQTSGTSQTVNAPISAGVNV